MSATIALIQDMLKEQLEPKIQDQINWIDVLLEDTMNVTGANKPGVEVDMQNNKFDIVALTDGMTGYAASETGALTASDIGLDRMQVLVKFTTASYRLEHSAIQASSKSQASLERLVDLYGMEIRRALLRTKGRFLRGDGTGIVGVLPAGVVTSATHTVSVKAAGTIASQNKYGLGALQVFQKGAKVSFGTAAAFAAGTQVDAEILSVNSDSSITLTGSATLGAASGANNRGGDNSDTWYIRFTGEYGNAPMGIMGLVDDGTICPAITTIQNVTRSTTPYMKSIVYDKANATSIVKDFRDLYTAVTKFNQNVKYFLVSEDVYAKYTDAITIMVQANQKDASYNSKLGVGHTGLMFAYGSSPVAIIQDHLLPYGTVYLLDPEQLFCADMFADDFIEDGIMTRVTGTRLYETVRAAYYNFGTYSSRKLGGAINYQSV